MAVIFDATDPHHRHRVGEQRIVRGDDQIARPAQHEPAGDTAALDGRDRGFGHITPPQCVFQIPAALGPVDPVEGDLFRFGPAVVFEVVPRREMFAGRIQDDHHDIVVGGGTSPRSIQFVQQCRILGIRRFGPVQRDRRDLIGDGIVDIGQNSAPRFRGAPGADPVLVFRFSAPSGCLLGHPAAPTTGIRAHALMMSRVSGGPRDIRVPPPPDVRPHRRTAVRRPWPA